MDEPAFPSLAPLDSWDSPYRGMTLRDYFAAKAMQTMLQGSGSFESHAEYAYKMADKMMEARNVAQ